VWQQRRNRPDVNIDRANAQLCLPRSAEDDGNFPPRQALADQLGNLSLSWREVGDCHGARCSIGLVVGSVATNASPNGREERPPCPRSPYHRDIGVDSARARIALTGRDADDRLKSRLMFPNDVDHPYRVPMLYVHARIMRPRPRFDRIWTEH
jgi:hypothetical protein